MRHHHPAFGQADAYLFHVQQVREDEVHAGVRERWISHRRTDALKGLDVELLNGEPLVGSISPIAGSHLLVHLLGSSLGKPVGQDLLEQKITLPLLGALQGSPEEEEIRALVREIPSHPEHCERIRRFVAERDGVGFAARRLSEWVERAVLVLEAFPDSPAKDYLAEIARFNEWREV